VSSSGDEGQQRLAADAPDFVVPELRPCRSRSEIGSGVRDDTVPRCLEERRPARGHRPGPVAVLRPAPVRHLSRDGRLACASCHRPARAFADGLPRGLARRLLPRNTPTLWNVVHERW